MAIRDIQIKNYRSIRDLRFRLKGLTVIHGANGTGKSNLFRALKLIRACARGQLAAHVAQEGGMPSALWAGPRKKGPVRMHLGFYSEDYNYAIELGLIPASPLDPTLFKLEPQVKVEEIWHGLPKRPGNTLFRRNNKECWVRDSELEKKPCETIFNPRESVLSQIREPENYPDIASVAGRVSRWRFYDQFDVSPSSPIRKPQVGFYTPVLSDSGWDLASALQTIIETGRSGELHQLVLEAFNSRVVIESIDGYFSLGFHSSSLYRPLKACELSDGTLRFLCLAAALLCREPAEFLVLNEPENSLHDDLMVPLASLIATAAKESQIWVITHSTYLAELLEGKVKDCKTSNLLLENGETRVEGQGVILED